MEKGENARHSQLLESSCTKLHVQRRRKNNRVFQSDVVVLLRNVVFLAQIVFISEFLR